MKIKRRHLTKVAKLAGKTFQRIPMTTVAHVVIDVAPVLLPGSTTVKIAVLAGKAVLKQQQR